MCVANAFESSSTELFLGLSMQKPGLIGGLRMFELVSENAEVDHSINFIIICQRLLRGLARRHLGDAHTDYHMTSQSQLLNHLPR